MISVNMHRPLHTFKSIQNFRDVSDSVHDGRSPKLYSHLFFRSATLDLASDDELDYLVHTLQAKTILDLRSEMEAKLSELGKPFTSFPVAASLRLEPSDVFEEEPEKVKVKKERIYRRRASTSSATQSTRKTIMVNFVGQKFRKHAVWYSAPFWCKVKIAGFVLTGQKVHAARLAGVEVMNKKRLEGLYRDFIDYCDAEINESLTVMANPSNYPLLVHCTHGKDRTGIIVALALAAVGVDEETIFEDYARSTKGLEKIHPAMVEELSRNGLDPCFADTPAHVMRETFAYIKSRYGSVIQYLRAIGFSDRKQHFLKMILVEDRKMIGIPSTITE